MKLPLMIRNMSKYKINIGSIDGDNNHIGDKIIYNTPQEFLKKHESISFTKIERELVDEIYANTNSDEERWELLESIKAIKNEDIGEEERQKAIISFRPLLETLKSTGNKLAYNIVVSYFDKIGSLDLIKHWFS